LAAIGGFSLMLAGEHGRELMTIRRLPALAIALCAVAIGAIANAAGVPECSLRLVVELTPDVPNPRDPEFLSSLLSNHPSYRLIWVGAQDAFHSILDLSGPGPDSACQDVVQTMRKDARVVSVQEE